MKAVKNLIKKGIKNSITKRKLIENYLKALVRLKEIWNLHCIRSIYTSFVNSFFFCSYFLSQVILFVSPKDLWKWFGYDLAKWPFSANPNLFKVNKENTRTMSVSCLKLTKSFFDIWAIIRTNFKRTMWLKAVKK